jgi:hypothetical protein
MPAAEVRVIAEAPYNPFTQCANLHGLEHRLITFECPYCQSVEERSVVYKAAPGNLLRTHGG